MKKRLYIDMDGTLCDFDKAFDKGIAESPSQIYPQSKYGFFADLDEMPGAIESFNLLKEKYDVWILTRPSFKNINCFSDKAKWVLDHLGYSVLEKLIICGDKSLVKGDYLIDDMCGHGQENFEGEWIQIYNGEFKNWEIVVNYLMNK